MKISSKGFYQYAKTLSEEEMHNLVNLVDKKIDEAINNIENAKFDINPKHLSTDKEITGCKYCSYKDICFRKNEDIKELNKYKDLSFLKSGDNNE
jgi:ATP-dependent helicase/DNAse subunit B